jgi:hypothetical protein
LPHVARLPNVLGVDRYPYVVAVRFVAAEISASQRMRASSLERIMAPLK